MIDSVIGLDVRRDDERAVPGARMGRGGGMGCVGGGEPAPARAARAVEGRWVGRGGAFWYEVPHWPAIRWQCASPLALFCWISSVCVSSIFCA